MIEKSWNENLNERKEFLEKQLKKLSDLKAQILKWEKETEKKDELWKLNQEIAKIEIDKKPNETLMLWRSSDSPQ